MRHPYLTRSWLAAAALSAMLSPIAFDIAAAQSAPPPVAPDYPLPPPGYDGSRPPPPPPGYEADPDYARQRAEDARYGDYTARWAQQNCVKSGGNVGTGAVLGGLIGALFGSGIAGRGSHGAGAAIGGIAGAAGGAAIAQNAGGETSPGCPPGFVVRRSAPAFYYDAYAGPYYYAAPPWYQPWIFIGGRWDYRPYPYRSYYYQHYYRGPARPGPWGHRRY